MKMLKRFLPILLAFSLLCCGLPFLTACHKNGDGPVGEDPELPPFGNQIGNRCYSMDVSLLGKPEETFNASENKGKVTVINFWGTWCGPCKSELPAFAQLSQEYEGTVTVFAVHSNAKDEDPESYVMGQVPDNKIVFGQDTEKDTFYYLLGGNGSWPITIILDTEGVIRYRKIGMLSHEKLKAAVDSALAGENPAA